MKSVVSLKFNKILQSETFSALSLGTEKNEITIYTDPQVGKDLQVFLQQGKKIRPSCHELIESILDGFSISPLHVQLYDVEESIYFAKLFLEKEEKEGKTVLEIDARPSDCITLAVLYNLPIYCAQEVLDKAGSSPNG